MTNDNRDQPDPTAMLTTEHPVYLDQLAQGLAYGQMAMTAPYWERNPDFAIEIMRKAINMQLHELFHAQGHNKSVSLAHVVRDACQAHIDGNAPPPEEIYDALPDDVLANLG